MNLGAATVVLRQRTLAEVLDLGARLTLGPAFGLFLRLAAMAILPCFALTLGLRYLAGAGWVLVWIVAACLTFLLEGVFTLAGSRLLFADPITARGVLGLFGRRLGAHLGASVVKLGIFAGAASLLVMLPFAWVRASFMTEASLLEHASSIGAWTRSGQLIAGRSSSALSLSLALLLARLGIMAAAELLGHGLVDQVLQLGRPFGSVLGEGGSPYALAGLFLSSAYVATARFLGYIDLRTRSDGWDVQVKFMSILTRDQADRLAQAEPEAQARTPRKKKSGRRRPARAESAAP